MLGRPVSFLQNALRRAATKEIESSLKNEKTRKLFSDDSVVLLRFFKANDTSTAWHGARRKSLCLLWHDKHENVVARKGS